MVDALGRVNLNNSASKSLPIVSSQGISLSKYNKILSIILADFLIGDLTLTNVMCATQLLQKVMV